MILFSLIALLAGSAMTFAYSPFNIWPVALLGLIVAIRQLLRFRHRAFLTGWLFGLGWFGAGISWVHVSISQFGGLPLIASIGLMALLCSYLALYPALAFYLTSRFIKPTLWPLALPFFWVLSEWLRSWFLTGFPWLSVGYSQLFSPLSGWIPIIGETGVSALLVMLASSVVIGIQQRKYIPAALVVVVTHVAGLVLNQVEWVTPSQSHRIAMVQGNIAQSLRWVPEQDRPTMEAYANMTDWVWDNDLIIWPEAAVPRIEMLAQDYLVEMDNRAAEHNTAIVTGIVNYSYESGNAWNNLIVLGKKSEQDPQGNYRYFNANRYAKHHLLPVGEFVPFEDWLRPLAPLFDLPMSSFSRGDFQQTNIEANGIHLAPAICFEIAFPRQVMANINADTDMIVTVSNDAWFGHSHGPNQHLEIAQMRAKEFGIPVIRATNNGITAFIDHHGDITAALPQFEAGTLSATVTSTKGTTPYRSFGDLFMWALSIIGLIAALVLQQRK